MRAGTVVGIVIIFLLICSLCLHSSLKESTQMLGKQAQEYQRLMFENYIMQKKIKGCIRKKIERNWRVL